jgi:hypothetical protein
MATKAESKAERESRELNERKYLDGLYAEREKLIAASKADTPAADKAKKRAGEVETEIKRCGGTIPSGRRGTSPVGDGSGTAE